MSCSARRARGWSGSASPRPTASRPRPPTCCAWAQTMLYAAAGGAADPADPEDLALLPEPLRTLAVPAACPRTPATSRPPGRWWSRSSATTTRPPGCSAEGSRRAARGRGAAVWRGPRTRTRRRPGSAGPRGRLVGGRDRRRHRGDCRRDPRSCRTRAAARPARRSRPRQTGRRGASPSARPATPLPAPAVRVPAALAGTWSGQVSQTNPTDVFQAQVYLAPGASSGSVHYSGASFSCAGDLVPESGSAGTPEAGPGHRPGPVRGGRGHR